MKSSNLDIKCCQCSIECGTGYHARNRAITVCFVPVKAKY